MGLEIETGDRDWDLDGGLGLWNGDQDWRLRLGTGLGIGVEFVKFTTNSTKILSVTLTFYNH